MLHIGLDLDNTLIDYEVVFGPVGVELGVLPPGMHSASKIEVRTHLRAQADGEQRWKELQSHVYGRFMDRASLTDGVAAFTRRLRAEGAEFSIVSHKTHYAICDPQQVDLWDAASRWMEMSGFYDATRFGFRRERVFFEETREAKLARIGELRCQLFIDDLPEVLCHPSFPRGTTPLWFARDLPEGDGLGLTPHRTWLELTQAAIRAMSGI